MNRYTLTLVAVPAAYIAAAVGTVTHAVNTAPGDGQFHPAGGVAALTVVLGFIAAAYACNWAVNGRRRANYSPPDIVRILADSLRRAEWVVNALDPTHMTSKSGDLTVERYKYSEGLVGAYTVGAWFPLTDADRAYLWRFAAPHFKAHEAAKTEARDKLLRAAVAKTYGEKSA